MRKFIFLLLASIILFSINCSTFNVKFDYDSEEDFSKFKTFDFLKVPDDVRVNELVLRRIYRAIGLEFKNKGFTRVMNNADLLVAVHANIRDRINVVSWGYGYAPYYWYGYWGPHAVSAYRYEEGTLAIDIVKASEETLIWRGVGQGVLPEAMSPEEMDEMINKKVAKILREFPPKK